MSDDNIRDFHQPRYDRLEAMIADLAKKMDAQFEQLRNQIDAVSAMNRRDTLGLQAEFYAFTKRIEKRLETLS